METKFRLLRPLGKDVFPEYEKRSPSWPATAGTQELRNEEQRGTQTDTPEPVVAENIT